MLRKAICKYSRIKQKINLTLGVLSVKGRKGNALLYNIIVCIEKVYTSVADYQIRSHRNFSIYF